MKRFKVTAPSLSHSFRTDTFFTHHADASEAHAFYARLYGASAMRLVHILEVDATGREKVTR